MDGKQQMDRRTFMRWSVAAAGGIGASAWVSGCFSAPLMDDEEGGGWQGDPLAAQGPVLTAWEAARSEGRPLLVLVVPAELNASYARGADWGAIFMHAPVETLAELASFEIVCASLAEARASLPQVTGFPETEVSVIVLEPDKMEARTLELDHSQRQGTRRLGMDKANAAVKEQMQRQSLALREFLAPSKATLTKRARASSVALGIELPLNDTALDGELARRAPAIARLAAEESEAEPRAAWLTALSSSFQANYTIDPPAGSHWATNTGCGAEIEGLADLAGVSCGMAMVPELSRRFLYFNALHERLGALEVQAPLPR